MEEEARLILRDAVGRKPSSLGTLPSAIRARIAPLGGVDLELPPREPATRAADLRLSLRHVDVPARHQRGVRTAAPVARTGRWKAGSRSRPCGGAAFHGGRRGGAYATGSQSCPAGRRQGPRLPLAIEAILREDFRGPHSAVRQRRCARVRGRSPPPAVRQAAPWRRRTARSRRSRDARGIDGGDAQRPGLRGHRASRSSIPGRRHERNDRSLRAGQDRRPAQGRRLEPDRRFERAVRTRAAGRHAGRLRTLRPAGPAHGGAGGQAGEHRTDHGAGPGAALRRTARRAVRLPVERRGSAVPRPGD